jgi:hypothetical protein
MSTLREYAIRSQGTLIAGILLMALASFELFNFSTTEVALIDFVGDGAVFGIHWGSLLAMAFCGIDLAGLSRLFTPERGRDEPAEVWYLFGAWLLGATINAVLTWWTILDALESRSIGNAFVTQEQLLTIVPIAISVLVWLTRVLLIGALSVASDGWLSITHTASRTGSRTTRTDSVRKFDEKPRPVRELDSTHGRSMRSKSHSREYQPSSRRRATASSVRSVRRSPYNRRYR